LNVSNDDQTVYATVSACFEEHLTLWESAYDIFVLWNQPKTSCCRLPYQRPSSSADCTRVLLKGSSQLASLLDCTQKKNFGWGLQIFVS